MSRVRSSSKGRSSVGGRRSLVSSVGVDRSRLLVEAERGADVGRDEQLFWREQRIEQQVAGVGFWVVIGMKSKRRDWESRVRST